MLSRISSSESGTKTAAVLTASAATSGTASNVAVPAAMTANTDIAGTGNTDVVFYLVRKSWDKPNTQIAAFTKIENAENCVNCNPGYAAFDEAGNQVYPQSPNKPNKL